VTGESPLGDAERGLPGKQGAFTTSLPWILRCLLAGAIGATVGFIFSAVFAPSLILGTVGWATIGALASAATLLSIRKVQVWHLSTFADGMLVGLLAWPILVLFVALSWRIGVEGYIVLLLRFFGWLFFLQPCGWLAGFAYHLALSAVERARAKDEDTSS
jgi:hypothetical protein